MESNETVTIVSDFAHFSPETAALGTAVTIGNFDGCHVGHQLLILSALGLAKGLGGTPVAVTFTPRPEAFFRGSVDEVLFTPEQKSRAFAELGIQRQVVQTFDEAFSRLSHERFYEDLLCHRLGARALVVGDNFRFGHQRLGDAAWLRARAVADGFLVTVHRSAIVADAPVSSTRIRETLRASGNVKAAAEMLGRPYLLEGIIRKGDQLGRTIGTPTANLEEVGQLLPRFGIYAGYVWLAKNSSERPVVMKRPDDAIPAVFSIGIRPTLDAKNPPVRIEAHLLAGTFGADEFYGRRAGYYLTDRIRDEAKLDGLDELKKWIARDVAEAKRLLRLS